MVFSRSMFFSEEDFLGNTLRRFSDIDVVHHGFFSRTMFFSEEGFLGNTLLRVSTLVSTLAKQVSVGRDWYFLRTQNAAQTLGWNIRVFFLLFSGVIFKNTKWYSNTFQLLSWLTWLYLLEVRTCQLPRKSQPSNCIISYCRYCVKYYWTRRCFLKAVFWYYFVKNCSPPSCRKEIARRWLGRSTVQQSLHPPKKNMKKKTWKAC